VISKADLHWRKTRRLTFTLICFWLFITFGLTWFARSINEVVILGFPLGFYMAAQGALVSRPAKGWQPRLPTFFLDHQDTSPDCGDGSTAFRK